MGIGVLARPGIPMHSRWPDQREGGRVNKTKRAVSYQVRLSRDCERKVMKLEVEILLLSIVDLANHLVLSTGCCRNVRGGRGDVGMFVVESCSHV